MSLTTANSFNDLDPTKYISQLLQTVREETESNNASSADLKTSTRKVSKRQKGRPPEERRLNNVISQRNYRERQKRAKALMEEVHIQLAKQNQELREELRTVINRICNLSVLFFNSRENLDTLYAAIQNSGEESRKILSEYNRDAFLFEGLED